MKMINHLIRYNAAAIVAVLISSTIGQAQADTFQISDAVNGSFKEYLRDITSTNNGAFAVTAGGTKSFYSYCEDASFCHPVTHALKECRQRYDEECVILAKGKDPEFVFEVVELFRSLENTDPIMLNILKQEDLERAVVGNTISGYSLNKLEWSQYYAPDGTLYENGSPTDTKYKIKNDKICHNEGTSSEWCMAISQDGDHLKFINPDGDLMGEFTDAWILPGQH